MVERTPYTVEMHYAVSGDNPLPSKYAVSHVGFSIGDVSYNFGRSEGRDNAGIADGGPYVGVRSTYRKDGYYLWLTGTRETAEALKAYVDGYIDNRTEKTSAKLPDEMVEKMWFVRMVKGLSDINTLKGLGDVDERTYLTDLKSEYPLLEQIPYTEFEKFRGTSSDTTELSVLKRAYPFFGQMPTAAYSNLKQYDRAKFASLADAAARLKGDLDNRMYDTFLLKSAEFNNGHYDMTGGENCVKAAIFFLKNGFQDAAKKLAGKPAAAEAKKLEGLIGDLASKKTPWNVFKIARKHCVNDNPNFLIDVPDDNIYWKVQRKKSVIADSTGDRLRPSQRRGVIRSLLTKTDVTAYEKQALEYVQATKVAQGLRPACDEFKDILAIGTGGGAKTRFE